MGTKNPILIKTEEDLINYFGSPRPSPFDSPPTAKYTGTVTNAMATTNNKVTVGDVKKMADMIRSASVSAGDIYVDSASSNVNVFDGRAWSRAVWGSEDLYTVRNDFSYTSKGKSVSIPKPTAQKRLAELDNIERLAEEFPQIGDAYKKLLTLVKLHNNDDENPDR